MRCVYAQNDNSVMPSSTDQQHVLTVTILKTEQYFFAITRPSTYTKTSQID